MEVIDVGKTLRLRRMFRNGKALFVPIDDSLISGPENGLRDIRKTIQSIVSSKATAMMMTYGSFIRNYDIIGDFPCLLNVTGSTIRSQHTNKVLIHSVEDALRVGFSGIAAHINISSIFESSMLELLGNVAVACNKYSMPLMIISYPRSENGKLDENYLDLKENNPTEYANILRHCVRIAVELGADIIKTHYSGDTELFRSVIDAAEGVPVIISGQKLVSEESALLFSREAISAGSAGICFGRNIYNRENIVEYIEKLSNALWD